MLKIEVKNIAGLIGNHSFDFEEGLSVIHAPNGTGKSSLLKALHLIIGNERIPETQLKNYLSEKEINGFVKATLDDLNLEVQLQRKADTVKISYSNIDDSVFKHPSEELAYVRAISDLYQGILKNDFSFITSWYHRITEDNKYELFYEISMNILSDYKMKRDELKKKLTKDTSRTQDQIGKLKNEIEILEKSIKSISNSEEYQKFSEENKGKKDKRENLKAKVYELTQKKENTINRIIKYENDLNDAKHELETLKKKLDNFEADYPVKKAQFERKEKELDNIEKKLDTIKQERYQIEEKLTYEKTLLSDYKKLLKRETCPTCHQNLDPLMIKDLVSKGQNKVLRFEENTKSLKIEEMDLAKKIKHIENEYVELKNFLKTEVETLRENILEKEKVVKQLQQEIPKLKEKREDLSQKIDQSNSKLLEIQKELSKENPYDAEIYKLEAQKNSKSQVLRDLENKLEESGENKAEYLECEKFIKRAELIQKHYEEKVIHLKKESFNKINKALLNSFELLELAKLKRVEFGEKNGKYTLDIVRENNVYTSLEKLSGAEKSLITIIITWVVKQMVIPDEPIFLIDEVTTEMDDTRFKDILNYISENVNYVIVARHKPYEGTRNIISSSNIISSIT